MRKGMRPRGSGPQQPDVGSGFFALLQSALFLMLTIMAADPACPHCLQASEATHVVMQQRTPNSELEETRLLFFLPTSAFLSSPEFLPTKPPKWVSLPLLYLCSVLRTDLIPPGLLWALVLLIIHLSCVLSLLSTGTFPFLLFLGR